MAAPRVLIENLPEQPVPEPADLLVVQNGAITKKMLMSSLTVLTTEPVSAHINDDSGAHAASAISAQPNAAPMTGTDVQTQLSQIAAELIAVRESEHIEVGPVPPSDTEWLWADTNEGGAGTSTSPPYLNVLDYGAVGDGGTDDTAAFVAALAVGDPVCIPPGTYSINDVNVPANSTIFGLGDASVVKRRAGQTRVLTIVGSNVYMRDFKIDGNIAAAGSTNSGLVQAFTAGLTNLRFQNMTLVDAYSAGFHLGGASQLVIDNCRLINAGEVGILITANGYPSDIADVQVTNNYIDRSMRTTDAGGHHSMLIRGSDDGITRKLRRCVIANNVVKQHASGGICIEAWAYDMSITGNVCEGGLMGISTLGSEMTVTGNVAKAHVWGGIELSTSGPIGSGRSACVGNIVQGDGVSGTGIVISNVNGPDETNISNNLIVGVKNEGIYILGPARSLVSGNYVSFCSPAAPGTRIGIRLLGIGRGSPLAHTTITGNFIDGVTLEGSDVVLGIAVENISGSGDPDVSLAITGNTVTNGHYGIQLRADGVDFRGTVVGNNIDASVIWAAIELPVANGGTTTGVIRAANRGDTPTITGAKGGNVALTSLLTALATQGLIVDSTT